jgi:putative spermidine/putrescine transport system substrate-binding protein
VSRPSRLARQPVSERPALIKVLAVLAVSLVVAAACDAPRTSPTADSGGSGSGVPVGSDGGPDISPSATDGPRGTYREFAPDPALLAAAIAEGLVTTLGLPDGPCNVPELIRIFRDRTHIQVNELQPGAEDATALQALADSVAKPDATGPDATGPDATGPDATGPDATGSDQAAPDVVELGLAAANGALTQGLLQAHQVATSSTIPEAARGPDGFWTGAWYGVITFEVNTDVAPSVPGDWSDLLQSKYAAQIAVSGDPRTAAEAMHAVYAAALANGGSLDDASPGLEFFGDLKAAGTLLPVVAKTGTVAARETPVRLAWSYNALADRAALDGTAGIEVVVPATGRLAGVSVQAISAAAPHPNAARLWLEFVASDEGQNLVLEGACHPIRLDHLVARSQVPPARLAVLPDTTGTTFPTAEQLQAAGSLIEAGWDDLGIDIVCTFECE